MTLILYMTKEITKTGNMELLYESMTFIPILTNVSYADYILKTSLNKDHYKIIGKYSIQHASSDMLAVINIT